VEWSVPWHGSVAGFNGCGNKPLCFINAENFSSAGQLLTAQRRCCTMDLANYAVDFSLVENCFQLLYHSASWVTI
jgi:hypothetical protein